MDLKTYYKLVYSEKAARKNLAKNDSKMGTDFILAVINGTSINYAMKHVASQDVNTSSMTFPEDGSIMVD